jgi:hypothetical protein
VLTGNVLEVETGVYNKNVTLIERKLAVVNNATAVKKVVDLSDYHGVKKNSTNYIAVLEKNVSEGLAEGISDKPEGKIGRWRIKAGAAANVKWRNVKVFGLPVVGGRDKSEVRGKTFERDDWRKNWRVVEELAVGGEIEKGEWFELQKGSPLNTRVVVDDDILVRVRLNRRVSARGR